MNTKRCCCCKETKKVNEFSWKRKGQKRQDVCKVCHRAYNKNHYAKNKKYYIDKANKRNAKTKDEVYEKIYQYFLTHPCVDCGTTEVLVLEFDHRGNKEFDISTMACVGKCKWEKIEPEIAKCDVRCRNCHKKKTSKQFNTWMYRRVNSLVA